MPTTRKRKYEQLEASSSGQCKRCSEIKYEHLLDSQADIGPEGLHVALLGKPNSKDFHEDCQLCELFLSVAPQYKRSYKLELRVFRASSCRVAWVYPQADEESDTLVLVVIRHNSRLRYQDVQHEIGARGFLYPVISRARNDDPVQAVNTTSLPYSLFRGWIEACNKSHSATDCTSDLRVGELPIQIQVIDCLTRRIVPLPKDARYITLSYVWGSARAPPGLTLDLGEPLSEGLVLPESDLSLTVRDAMQAVLGIGERYLWVDKYCILQDDGAHKQEAIAQMGQIYSKAELTIVALHGHDAEAGLPGVSRTQRTGSQLVPTSEGFLISSLPPLEAVIGDSTWSTRGWTYQEARLASRCLFFAQNQVYFSCRGMTVSETMHLQDRAMNRQVSHATRGLDPRKFDKAYRPLLEGLFLDRLLYTQRHLTFKSDKLDAFLGLLGSYPVHSFWGVPIATFGWDINSGVGFALGLLWTRRPSWSYDRHIEVGSETRYKTNSGEKYTRIPARPTWSWVSVEGSIFQQTYGRQSLYGAYLRPPKTEGLTKRDLENHLHTHGSRHRPFDLGRTKPSFSVKFSNDSLSLEEDVKSHSRNPVIPNMTGTLTVEGELVKILPLLDKGIGLFGVCDLDDRLMTPQFTIYASLDVDASYKHVSSAAHALRPMDAWVLVEWNDDQPVHQTRFVLMLLHWVAEGRAERLGLLGEYRDNHSVASVSSIPRRRVKFELV